LPSSSSLFLSVAGVPIATALSCVHYSPTLFHYSPTLYANLTIFRRPTLRMIFVIQIPQSLVGAPSLRNAPGSQRTRVGDRTVYRHRIRALMECGWVRSDSEVGKEALRVLEELETEFPGKIFPHFILFIQLYLTSVSQRNEDVFPSSASLPRIIHENATIPPPCALPTISPLLGCPPGDVELRS